MAPTSILPVFAFPSGRQGDVREAEFDSVQPKVTLSWRPERGLDRSTERMPKASAAAGST